MEKTEEQRWELALAEARRKAVEGLGHGTEWCAGDTCDCLDAAGIDWDSDVMDADEFDECEWDLIEEYEKAGGK